MYRCCLRSLRLRSQPLRCLCGKCIQQKNEFHVTEFLRRVRDEQAAMLKGKSDAEVLAFFASFKQGKARKPSPDHPKDTAHQSS
jgi:hypothetical protein